MTQHELPEDILVLQQKLIDGSVIYNQDSVSVLFEFQSRYNHVYHEFLQGLKFDIKNPTIEEIPFLPISTFKNFEVKSGFWKALIVFKSSSATGKGRSHHYVRDESLYQKVCKNIFENRFGPLQDMLILALLPGYLERGDSSLVYMADHFMNQSGQLSKGFYLDHYEELSSVIEQNSDKEIILLGVPFAFLKCMERIGSKDWSNVTIIETGGMKGQRKEMPRKELHQLIYESLKPKVIHSEYGMTELLSQAYTGENGLFQPSASLKIFVRELNDPFSPQKFGKPGVLNVFDLANIHTCSFIETEDMAVDHNETGFEVIGRVDNREIRGCNLLAG